MEDQNIYVGVQKPISHIVNVIPVREIKNYLSPLFYEYYKIWECKRNGYGLPGGMNYMKYPPWFVSIINAFDAEYSVLERIKNGYNR